MTRPSQEASDSLKAFGMLAKEKIEIDGDDFREGKISLPVVLAWRRGDEQERVFWRRTLEKMEQNEGDLEQAISLGCEAVPHFTRQEDSPVSVVRAAQRRPTQCADHFDHYDKATFRYVCREHGQELADKHSPILLVIRIVPVGQNRIESRARYRLWVQARE